MFFLWFVGTLGFLLIQVPILRATENPPEVLIWYVNETAPLAAEQRNYDQYLEWLDGSELSKARELAANLRKDLREFRESVAKEQQEIENATQRHAGKLPVVIATNQLAQQGIYRLYDPQTLQFVNVPCKFPTTHDYILASNPLVMADSLALILTETARKFDPARYRFVLITKSHGSPEYALTVRLPRHHEDITREQLLASLAGTLTVSHPKPKIGISKQEYLRLLHNAGSRYKMKFQLVFIEACQGVFAEVEAESLPTNVEVLFSSGNRGLQYQTLNYPSLLSAPDDSKTSLSQKLNDFLAPNYLAIYRVTSWNWLAWAALIPLLLMLAWTIFKLIRSKTITNR
ncbi:MAG: hypothetical protein SFX18_14090 [Pirellulales bacterium]|nr:hypothetical protein [Pirellulales bacterium]